MSSPSRTGSGEATDHGPLGHTVAYPQRYDPRLLHPLPRAAGRAALGIGKDLPFHGVDIWNAYELSWLDPRGKPEVAVAEFRVPATSPNLVESKSFKLYLNGFNGERIGEGELERRQREDHAQATGADIGLVLTAPRSLASIALAPLAGESIDGEPIDIDRYGPPDASLLGTTGKGAVVEETLVSDLLRSNCPVTGQPDWASVQVRYRGARIDRAGLLRYLVSFRTHAGFHEQCVEQVYCDLLQRCRPERLSVYARYTRRGGLDINPWRSSEPGQPANTRSVRQ
jgi:7-cyano-7-deazaguanine reductase